VPWLVEYSDFTLYVSIRYKTFLTVITIDLVSICASYFSRERNTHLSWNVEIREPIERSRWECTGNGKGIKLIPSDGDMDRVDFIVGLSNNIVSGCWGSCGPEELLCSNRWTTGLSLTGANQTTSFSVPARSLCNYFSARTRSVRGPNMCRWNRLFSGIEI
jgi:hypothetical protein